MIHVDHEHPYRAIIDTAEVKGCDLIVMASHGRRGIAAIVLGSETVKSSHIPRYRFWSIDKPDCDRDEDIQTYRRVSIVHGEPSSGVPAMLRFERLQWVNSRTFTPRLSDDKVAPFSAVRATVRMLLSPASYRRRNGAAGR